MPWCGCLPVYIVNLMDVLIASLKLAFKSSDVSIRPACCRLRPQSALDSSPRVALQYSGLSILFHQPSDHKKSPEVASSELSVQSVWLEGLTHSESLYSETCPTLSWEFGGRGGNMARRQTGLSVVIRSGGSLGQRSVWGMCVCWGLCGSQ